MPKPSHLQWGATLHPAAAERSQEPKKVPQRSPYPRTQIPDPPSPMAIEEEEDVAWARKSILSIDDGGIRGYSSLLILQALMNEIEKIELSGEPVSGSSIGSPYVDTLEGGTLYRPCHYFDYIAGSSSSSLIAIMLGRYRMTVDEAMPQYRHLCAGVLREEPSQSKWYLPGIKDAKARHKKMHKWLEGLHAALPSPGEVDGSLKSDPNRCRTLAYNMDFLKKPTRSELTVSRSYDDPPEPPQLHPATRMMVRLVKGEEVDLPLPPLVPYDPITFINPSLEVVKEVASQASGESGRIDILLSIGGANAVWGDEIFSNPRTLQNKLDNSSMDINDEVGYRSMRSKFHHRRLDVHIGLQTLGRNEWVPHATGEETLRRIEKVTDELIQRRDIVAPIVNEIRTLARLLVDKRWRRAHTVQWQRWATGRLS